MVTPELVNQLYERLKLEAEASGYHLNPDAAFARALVEGLLVNEERYGYRACPCRLVAGDKNLDIDIICPCDYRDADLTEFGACYCALYVSREALNGGREITSIPERRPPYERRSVAKTTTEGARISSLPLPVWRCRVCGYLCARDGPPDVCPICKAGKDRFERFI